MKTKTTAMSALPLTALLLASGAAMGQSSPAPAAPCAGGDADCRIIHRLGQPGSAAASSCEDFDAVLAKLGELEGSIDVESLKNALAGAFHGAFSDAFADGVPSFSLDGGPFTIAFSSDPFAADDDAHTFSFGARPFTVAFSAAAPPDGDAKPGVRLHASTTARSGGSGDTLSTSSENGKLTSVKHNGKDIPLSNVRRQDGKLQILDDAGKVVYETAFGSDDSVDHSAGKSLRLRVENSPADPNTFVIRGNRLESGPGIAVSAPAEDPKVMIGIQLAEPDGLLLGHFGLEKGSSTLVSGVYADLPADKAGLKPYDIIVSVDGSDDAAPDKVRAALKDKSPGDAVRLSVIQKGQRKDLSIKVIDFDRARFENAPLDSIKIAADSFSGAAVQGGPVFAPFGGGPDQDRFKALNTIPPEKIQIYIDQAMKHMDIQDDDHVKLGDRLLRNPASPGADSAPAGSRVKELEERLDRLEKMLERALERQGAAPAKGGPRFQNQES